MQTDARNRIDSYPIVSSILVAVDCACVPSRCQQDRRIRLTQKSAKIAPRFAKQAVQLGTDTHLLSIDIRIVKATGP